MLGALVMTIGGWRRRCALCDAVRMRRVLTGHGAWLWEGREDVAGAVTMVMDRRWVVSVASLVQVESEEPRWQKR